MYIKKIFIVSFLPVFFFLMQNPAFTQDEDSLLFQKISEIDITLNSLDESEEDLYMNPVSFQTFFDELADDGEWIIITKEEIEKELNDGEGQSFASFYQEEDGLVYIWKPKGEDNDWRPYMNGKWVYTTSGWMWASNYKWGWACYHYGRWWKSKSYGWVWMPGYVWAPAWVKWRITGNHVGWTPLSPKAKWKGEEGITAATYKYENANYDWVFVDKSKFTDEVDKSVVMPVKENSGLIKNSESVLEMKLENGKVTGKGPNVSDIEKRTGKTIKPRELKFRKEKGKTLIGESIVSAFRENFKKLNINPATGKYHKIDKPKKFKKSPKAKKILKKIKIRNKNKIRIHK